MCRGFGRWLNDCNFSNDIGCRWWQLTYHVQYTWQRHIIIRNSNIVTFSSGNWGNVCLCTSLSKNKRCRCTQTTNPCTEKQSWNPVLFVFDPGGHVHFSYQNLSHSFSYFSWWGMGVTTGRDVLATTPVGVILSPRRHEFDLTIEVWRDPVEFFRIKMILWGFHWIWMTMLMLMLLFWIHFMKRYTYSCQNSKFHQTKWSIMLLVQEKPIYSNGIGKLISAWQMRHFWVSKNGFSIV